MGRPLSNREQGLMTVGELARFAGASSRVVSNLVSKGLLLPDRPSSGMGGCALFLASQAPVFAAAVKLANCGVQYQHALAAARNDFAEAERLASQLSTLLMAVAPKERP